MMNHNEEKAFIEKVFKKYNGVINTNNIAVLGEINYIDPNKSSSRDFPNIVGIDLPMIDNVADSDNDKKFIMLAEIIINLYLADINVIYYYIKVGYRDGVLGNIAKYKAFKYVDDHRNEIAKEFNISFDDETVDKRMQIGTYGYSLYDNYVRTTLDSHMLFLWLAFEQLEKDDVLNILGIFADEKSKVNIIIKGDEKDEILKIKDGKTEITIPELNALFNKYVYDKDFYTSIKLNKDIPSIKFIVEIENEDTEDED